MAATMAGNAPASAACWSASSSSSDRCASCKQHASATSLDAEGPLYGAPAPLVNRVASEKHDSAAAEDEVWHGQLRATLGHAMAERDPKRTQMTRLKYGLEDGVEWTYHELAERFNMTKDVAKHIVRSEVNFLRRTKRRELQEFVGHN